MIEEAYVSFETAKLLKEKGFDEPCHHYYKNNDLMFSPSLSGRNSLQTNTYSAPTLQMTMRWLMKEKGIAIVPIISSVLDNEKFLWDIEITVAKTNETYHQGWVYESYERACEAAIKYSLKNLI